MELKVKDSIKGNYKTSALVVLLVGLFFIGLISILNLIYITIHLNHHIRWIVTLIISFIVYALFYLGYISYFLKVSRGETGDIKALFNKPELFLPSFIILVSTFLAFLIGLPFLIAPGVIFVISLSQAPYIAIDNLEIGGFGALRKSIILMKGRKKEYFRYILPYLKYFLKTLIVFILYLVSLKIKTNHMYLVTILNILLLIISIIFFIDFCLIIETAKAVYYNKLKE